MSEPSAKKAKKENEYGKSEKLSLTAEINQYEMQRILKGMNMHTKRIYFQLDQVESGNKTEHYYPQEFCKNWKWPCIKCGITFSNEPTIRIPKWDVIKDAPIFDMTMGFCSDVCYKNWIIESTFTDKGTECQNLYRFVLEYKNKHIDKISYLPLSFMKSRSPCGFMSDEEWKAKSENSFGFYVHPPFQLVETTSVISEKPLYQKTAKELGFKLNNTVTPEQQENFIKSLEAVKKQQKSKSSSSSSSVSSNNQSTSHSNEGIRSFFS